MTLGDYMKQNVLDPLGMHDTGFRVNQLPHTADRRAEVALRDADNNTLSHFDVVPEEPEIDSAGAGIHTTANDYACLLRAMLQAEPGVVSGKTAKEMFSPQLDPAQRKMLQDTLYAPYLKPAFIPEFPDGIELQYGYGGLLGMSDWPGQQRRKGSLCWTGAANSRWVSFIPICLIYGGSFCIYSVRLLCDLRLTVTVGDSGLIRSRVLRLC